MVRSSSCMASCVCVWCVWGGGGRGRSAHSSSKHTQSIQCTIFTHKMQLCVIELVVGPTFFLSTIHVM